MRFKKLLANLDHVLGRRPHEAPLPARAYLDIAQRLAERRRPATREERITGNARPGVSLSTLRVGDHVHTYQGTVYEIMGTRTAGNKRLIHALACDSSTLARRGPEIAWDAKTGRPYSFDTFGLGRATGDRRDRIRGVGPVDSSALAEWMPRTWKAGRHKRDVVQILDGWGREGGAQASQALELIKKIGDRALLPVLRRLADGDDRWNQDAARLLNRWER